MKRSHRQYINQWMWLCSNKTSFTKKQATGWTWSTDYFVIPVLENTSYKPSSVLNGKTEPPAMKSQKAASWLYDQWHMLHPRVLDMPDAIHEQCRIISATNVWQIELDGKWQNKAKKLLQEGVWSNAQSAFIKHLLHLEPCVRFWGTELGEEWRRITKTNKAIWNLFFQWTESSWRGESSTHE